MKFQPDKTEGVNLISRHEPGRIWVGAVVYNTSLLVPSQGPVQAWPPLNLAALTEAHFEQIAALQPEVVIFGSGEKLRFVSPALLRTLIAARIGFETMDTPAACRTYNVLASEGRRALAALLLPAPAPAPA